MARRRVRLFLVGFGAIAGAVARMLAERGAPVDLVGIGLRDGGGTRPGLPSGVPVLSDPAALATTGADLVIEAAGRDAVAPWGRAALEAGVDFAVSSTSAFAGTDLLNELSGIARASGAQLIVPPGALGGIDALSAAGRMGLASVTHRIVKPPRAWAGTEAAQLCDLAALTQETTFFSGTAAEAAARFAQNANVAMIVALAGPGPAAVRVALVADPSATTNRHEITAEGDFGRMALSFENAALAGNPKSSAMTALSLVRLVENRAAPVVI